MRPPEIADRLDVLASALRSLDADIERLLKPELQGCTFYAESGVIVDRNGAHHPVLLYTTDIKCAWMLPGANPNLQQPLGIVSDWLRR